MLVGAQLATRGLSVHCPEPPESTESVVAQVLAALSPQGTEEDAVAPFERVLGILRNACGADVALALQRVDAVTAVALASVPRGVLPDGMTTPALFSDALETGQSAYCNTEAAQVPRLARGAAAIIPWPCPRGTLDSRTLQGAVILIRHSAEPFSAPQRELLERLRGLFHLLTQLPSIVLRAEELRVRFEAVVQTLPHGLLFTDDSGAQAWVNDTAAAILQVPQGLVAPHIVANAMTALRNRADNHEQIVERLRHVLNRPSASLRDDQWIFSTPLRSVYSISCVPTKVRQVRGRLWVFIDITALYTAQQQLEENNAALALARAQADAANAAKSKFLANMSHEVRSFIGRRWMPQKSACGSDCGSIHGSSLAYLASLERSIVAGERAARTLSAAARTLAATGPFSHRSGRSANRGAWAALASWGRGRRASLPRRGGSVPRPRHWRIGTCSPSLGYPLRAPAVSGRHGIMMSCQEGSLSLGEMKCS